MLIVFAPKSELGILTYEDEKTEILVTEGNDGNESGNIVKNNKIET